MTPETACEPNIVVGCRGAKYHVPDLAAVDRHVAFLTMRMRRWAEKVGWDDDLVQTLDQDRDALLDHRWGLQLMATESPQPTG